MSIFNDVKNNNLVELKKYLQYGNINVVDDEEKCLLHHAVYGNAIDCADVLIENKIDINKQDINLSTPLIEASKNGNVGFVKLLVKNNVDVNIYDNTGNVALFYAIKSNNRGIVDLLRSRTNSDTVDSKKEDALFKAIESNYTYIEDLFINTITENYRNDTILHHAARYNNFKVIKKYTNRLLVNKKNKDNETVFFVAAKYSNRDIINYLLDYIPNTNIKNNYHENLIDIAKTNPFDVEHIISKYNHSQRYIDYKNNNKQIYNYISNNVITNFDKLSVNKKDNFELSLVDYVSFYNDEENYKLLTK